MHFGHLSVISPQLLECCLVPLMSMVRSYHRRRRYSHRNEKDCFQKDAFLQSRCVRELTNRDVECPVAYAKADELEAYVVGKPKKIDNFLDAVGKSGAG